MGSHVSDFAHGETFVCLADAQGPHLDERISEILRTKITLFTPLACAEAEIAIILGQELKLVYSIPFPTLPWNSQYAIKLRWISHPHEAHSSGEQYLKAWKDK